MKNSREMFEQWAYEKRVRGVAFSVEKFKAHGEQLYKNPELQSQWNAWQQATSIQRKSACIHDWWIEPGGEGRSTICLKCGERKFYG